MNLKTKMVSEDKNIKSVISRISGKVNELQGLVEARAKLHNKTITSSFGEEKKEAVKKIDKLIEKLTNLDKG